MQANWAIAAAELSAKSLSGKKKWPTARADKLKS